MMCRLFVCHFDKWCGAAETERAVWRRKDSSAVADYATGEDRSSSCRATGRLCFDDEQGLVNTIQLCNACVIFPVDFHRAVCIFSFNSLRRKLKLKYAPDSLVSMVTLLVVSYTPYTVLPMMQILLMTLSGHLHCYFDVMRTSISKYGHTIIFLSITDIQELLMTRSVLALVNGQPWDMHKPLCDDCELRFLHFKDEDPSLSNQVCLFRVCFSPFDGIVVFKHWSRSQLNLGFVLVNCAVKYGHGQVIHVHTSAYVTKQYSSVVAIGQWCSETRKVTAGLMLHCPCIVDFGTKIQER